MLARLSCLARTVLTRGLPMLLASAIGWTASTDGKILRDVAFSTYGTHSSDAELTRRLLTPATAARLQRQAAAAGLSFAAQPLDLAQEKFIVYVPARPPPRGYALVVFVPPWQQAGLPEGWIPVLDHFGAIYVSAARSGNDENTMARREPLALLAAQNIMAQYPIDAERVYIAGFSGGSHVALRLALGYPDLFHGAILNAGSDAIGDLTAQPPIPLPPRELFLQFQEHTRLVYITGERDASRVEDDMLSMHSMRQWCVYNVESIVEPVIGHTVARPDALARALASLDRGSSTAPDRLAQCRSAIDAEVDSKLARVESLLASGQRAAAAALLDKIDQRYGGLAAPRSLELAGK